jgi:hypothetical protein
MPLTGNQTRLFFEHQAQMGIPNATVIQLQTEGINVVADLADFDTKTRRPSSRSLLTFDALQEGYLILTLQRQPVPQSLHPHLSSEQSLSNG